MEFTKGTRLNFTPNRTHARNVVGWAQRNGLFFALVFLVLGFSLASPYFLTRANISVIVSLVAVTGIIAVPGAMLLLCGYVDLSVGSIAVLAAIAFGEFYSYGMGIGAATALALVVGTACGVLNGVLIAYLEFSPIVVTLGVLAGARGAAEYWSQAETVFGFGTGFASLGNGSFAGIDIPVWICAGVFLIGGYFWYRAPFGRHMIAVGVDRSAAHSAGINIRMIPFALYVASALAAGLGGLIFVSQLDAATLDIGRGLELEVLTAILLGGVSFLGGYGSLFGVLMGVLFIGVLSNGLIIVNISPFIKNLAIGCALVLAAGVDVLYRRLDRVRLPDLEDEPDVDGKAGDAPPTRPINTSEN
jgi:ribose transport system permease protein